MKIKCSVCGYEKEVDNGAYRLNIQAMHLEQTGHNLSEPKHVTSGNKSTTGRLFVLDLSSGEIYADLGKS